MILLVFCRLDHLPLIRIHALLSRLTGNCIIMMDARLDDFVVRCTIEFALIILILLSSLISFYFQANYIIRL